MGGPEFSQKNFPFPPARILRNSWAKYLPSFSGTAAGVGAYLPATVRPPFLVAEDKKKNKKKKKKKIANPTFGLATVSHFIHTALPAGKYRNIWDPRFVEAGLPSNRPAL